ncbi:MAG TPA: MoaD/ThiS family protein [Armatimonadaceae bacterium]|nr:MoaD/ThiS family protein [Armatimonadaceae bacterium]
MTVRVLLFGHYRDAAPPEAEGGAFALPLPDGATVADAARALAERDGRFADLLARTRVAVRAEFAAPDTRLAEGDELAFLPPMSGG